MDDDRRESLRVLMFAASLRVDSIAYGLPHRAKHPRRVVAPRPASRSLLRRHAQPK